VDTDLRRPLGLLETIVYTVDDRGVARITLNRPDAANARNQRMRDELHRAYDHVATSGEVTVTVLTGTGEKFFCAGMDLKEASGPETPVERRDRLRRNRDIEELANLPQPTIAAVNGYALGGGCEMALACDLRVMADEASIGLTEVTHGLMPGGGGTQRLPRLVGFARAAELIFLSERVDGVRAAALGLVNRHVPRAELHDAVDALAGRIADQPAAALRAAKEALLAGQDLPIGAAVERELDGLLFLLAEQAAERERRVTDAHPNGSDAEGFAPTETPQRH
jgi:enoyl-CoA hydratase/carnithine racemase